MAHEGCESFIGVFITPEITTEHIAPTDPARVNVRRPPTIVSTGVEFIFQKLSLSY
jgi:hypothetical protein